MHRQSNSAVVESHRETPGKEPWRESVSSGSQDAPGGGAPCSGPGAQAAYLAGSRTWQHCPHCTPRPGPERLLCEAVKTKPKDVEKHRAAAEEEWRNGVEPERGCLSVQQGQSRRAAGPTTSPRLLFRYGDVHWEPLYVGST